MIVGIDLGTTNSAVAIWKNSKPQLIANALGDFLTPSAVSLTESGEILVGMAARERQVTHPQSTATVFKRYIGTQQKTRLGRAEFSAEELSALVLKSLKGDVEAATGESVTGAVITVPAYFNDRQRKSTKRAGELAGLRVERLVNEPTAAALAFGIQDRNDKEPFLVFDLGGGTFDVSIVEVFDGIVEVRASAGDNRLGGEDFNDALINLARTRIDFDSQLGKIKPDILQELLRDAAERARRKLSENDSASFSITAHDKAVTIEITSADFDACAAPLLERLRQPVLRSLRDSDIAVASLSEIVLVGGSTRMPIVRKTITKMFGRFPNSRVHPDHAVALGAAAQAGLLASDSALDEIRLTDVCPFTLGVEHAEYDGRGNFRHGLFSPIIERNTAIPASRVGRYRTISDNQREVLMEIYQGEARNVASNVKLGTLRVPVPPRPAGEVAIDCRFTYDPSGILDVDVTIPMNGTKRNLLIADDDSWTVEEIERRRQALEALKFHPREDAENVAILSRAARCYESFIGPQRDQIGHWITQFEAALDSQDPRSIRETREQLLENLNAAEGERYL